MIDIKTFMLVLGIGNIGFAMLMAGYARNADNYLAITVWTWAKLIQGGSHLLNWLRPDLHLAWIDVTATSLLICGMALEVGALATFLGLRYWKRVLLPLTALALLVFQSARLGGAAGNELTALMSAIIALYIGMMAYILLRPREGTLLQRLIGINDVLFCLAMSARGYTALRHSHFALFTPALVQNVTYLTGYVLMIVNGFGFLLMCKQQDDKKMAVLATIDSLTGLVNRRAFFERTETARAFASRVRKPIALLMLDIDHFKSLNDRFGHATGDDALCVFAETATATLRDHDIMGRLGGEEFALVLPGTDLGGAMQAAERLRVAVAQAHPITSGNAYTMTVSIGVVIIDQHEHINAALARADHALYAAKSAGRNRVECGEVIHPRIAANLARAQA
ncbi:MAG: GGDEF domain-containing protein [Pseudomonadota bacterium]